MKRSAFFPVLAITSFTFLSSVSMGQAYDSKYPGVTEKDFAPQELLVKFKSTTSLQEGLSKVPGNVIGQIAQIGVVKFKLNSGQSVLAVAAALEKTGLVSYAEPNFVEHLFKAKSSFNSLAYLTAMAKQGTKVPNDPKYPQQYGPAQMRLPQAWALTQGKASVVVAVIDTGINPTHEDLKNKIVAGQYDFSDNDANATDDTGSGHGTHCAGIVAAETNNGIGVAGAGWNVSILPIKIFPNATAAVSAAAITYSADKGAKVLSMSYGSGFKSQTEQDAINYAFNKGVLPVAASGNDNSSQKFYPAGHDNCFSIGATNIDDKKASFSNYGDWVHVSAPGENILSTFLGATNAYVFESGTSMACPNVAGSAALLFSYTPLATNVLVRNALQSTADPSKDNAGNNWVKYGRINVYKALLKLPSPTPFFDRPSAADVFVGPGFTEGNRPANFVNAAGAAVWLGNPDLRNFEVSSVTQKGVGEIASIRAAIPFTRLYSNVRAGALRIIAKSSSPVSGFVLVYNASKQSYVNLGSITLGKEAKTMDISLPNDFQSYVSEGQVNVVLRTVAPGRLGVPAHTVSADQIVITGFEVSNN